MTIGKRQAVIFGAGLALGIAGAWFAFDNRPSAAREGSAPTARSAKATAPPSSAKGTGPGPASAAAASAVPCPAQTTTALGDAKDGQFQLQSDVAGKSDKDMAAFIVVGKEAAASGRARDAEVAFMMSCRVAEQHKGADSLPAADAKYQLAWHYANLALNGGRGGNRPELLRRAETLYADSLEIYRASHGPTHEKTRFAAEGLAALRTPAGGTPAPVTAQASPEPSPAKAPPLASVPARAPAAAQANAPATPPAPERAAAAAPSRAPAPAAAAARVQPPAPPAVSARVQPSPPPAPAVTRAPAAPPVVARAPAATPPAPTRSAAAQATMGAPGQAQGSAGVTPPAATPATPRVAVARGSATAMADAAEPIRPSFDCGKARSRSERIICADPELARQDRELGRLYARARDAAPDSAAFRRHSDQEWRRRETTCSDRECLLRWYAERRSQLSADISQPR